MARTGAYNHEPSACGGLGSIVEADARGWLGEIDGLKISLDAAQQKLAQMRKIRGQTKTVHMPAPTVRRPRR